MLTSRTIFVRRGRRPETLHAGGPSDADDSHALSLANLRFLGQAAQIPWIAGEHHDRPWLVKRDYGEKRVERAPVPRQPAPTETLTRSAAMLLINRDHRDPAEHAVHASVCGKPPKHFCQGRRSRDDTATALSDGLEEVARPRVTAGQFDETFGVENQGAAYSSS
jgi:hypothetical protein